MDLPIPAGNRVLLVDPPFFRLFGYTRWHYAVTLAVVGAYLRQRGYDVCVYDADCPTADCRSLSRSEVRASYHRYKEALANENHPAWAEVLDAVEAHRPRAVGLTATSGASPAAAVIARKVKARWGDAVQVFLGGSHVDGMLRHDRHFDFGPCYDFVVPKDAARFAAVFDRKPGRRLIANLARYSSDNIASLLTSVGCPNRCTFCYHSMDRCFVYRDPANLRSELEEILEIAPGASKIMVLDHCLFSNAQHFHTVVEILKGIGLPFSAGSRVTAVTGKKLDAFLDAGGARLNVGIESGSQEILDAVHKRISVEQIVARARRINAAGVPWMAYVMVGFPFETVEDLRRTEELLYRIHPTFVSINRFTPYPGTVIYEEMFQSARFDFSDLFQLDGGGCVSVAGAVQDYIDHLFTTFDQYNAAHGD